MSDDDIADITREFIAGLDDRVIAIREAAHALELEYTEDMAKRLGSLTHRLRGTAGSFGVGELGELARDIDKALVAPTDWNRVQAAISALAVAVRRIVASRGAGST